MTDVQPTVSAVDAQQSTATPDQPSTNGTATVAKEDVGIAGEVATVAVNPPDGQGTAEALVNTVAAPAAEEASSVAKDKKRKSSTGVPEHKTKKLNKKKSMPTLRTDCKPGDLYWARLKGYPAWPSVICDEEMLPETLLASRPVSAARPDGSLRDDFQEGGKSAKDRTFPIMFLSTNEFAWLVNTGLTPLDPEECKNPTAKLNKSLADAYRIAAEGPDLDHFKSLLQQFQEESAAFEAAQRQREAEAEEKAAAKAKRDAEKKARKSKGGDDEDTEMADADAPKSSKKRKKEGDSDGDAPKSKKTAKITKLNAPKTPNGDGTKKTSSSKPKKKVTAPKNDDKSAEQQAPMTESERLEAREKHVLYLRHKLQKAFLSRETAPKGDEMPDMADYFKQLEKFEDLEPDLIRKTKIHKVLKGIVKLDSVPRDDEFTFKQRSQNMLEAWNRRMEADADVPPKPAVSADKPVTNGHSDQTKEGTDNVEAAAVKQADEIDKKIEQVEKTEEKPAEIATQAKQEPEIENAGGQAAAPDADGDVKMDDKAAGKPEHE